MKIDTAIITCGKGFIGVNLMKSLEQRYDKIICVDNFSLGNLKFFKSDFNKSKIEIVNIDFSKDLIFKRTFQYTQQSR